MQRYSEEVGKSLLEDVKQERNCSEDESQYTEKVTTGGNMIRREQKQRRNDNFDEECKKIVEEKNRAGVKVM
jgi:hypothetical protein